MTTSTPSAPTLGTLLRHLIEQLDGAVEAAYAGAGLAEYRPRYTPVVRALLALGPSSIRAIALHAGTTHSAASQTVAQMTADKLVTSRAPRAGDQREKVVALSPKAIAMVPRLERQWTATNRAAAQLDRELSAPLSAIALEALAALERKPFAQRIADARRGADARRAS